MEQGQGVHLFVLAEVTVWTTKTETASFPNGKLFRYRSKRTQRANLLSSAPFWRFGPHGYLLAYRRKVSVPGYCLMIYLPYWLEM